jgi:hypothetical protein
MLLSAAAPLRAADAPKFELAAGYAYMHDSNRAEAFPAGWAISTAGYINSWIAVAAEVGGNYDECKTCQIGPFAAQTIRGTDRTIRVHTYLAGPKIASHAASAVTPFGQVLFGGSHISGGVEFDGALNTGFTYQPGGGVDVRVTPRTGIRVEGDYRVIRTSGRNNKEVRFMAAAVFAFGTR